MRVWMTAHTAFGAALLAASAAHGQCPAIDFESLAAGTAVSTQYAGVTFSAMPGTCPGGPSPRVVVPAGGTLSGTQALGVEHGCPDFGPDYLVMTFDDPQPYVTFTLGTSIGSDAEIRSYDGSGALLASPMQPTGEGAYSLVQVGTEGGPADIKRIEIDSGISSDFEYIDDLRFALDATPPEVEISAPAFRECVCSGLVPIVGSVADSDGAYECDTLSYRPVNANPSEPWVTASTACGAFTGTLHLLDVSPLPHGSYYVMISGRNECGLESSDVTVIRVDRNAPSLALTEPADLDVVCGQVEIWGNATDGCSMSWSLDYTELDGPNAGTVAGGAGQVPSCRLGIWDTTVLPDGDYLLSLSGLDDCGNVAAPVQRTVTVDNAAGCACGPDINGDGVVNIVDLLALLAAWG